MEKLRQAEYPVYYPLHSTSISRPGLVSSGSKLEIDRKSGREEKHRENHALYYTVESGAYPPIYDFRVLGTRRCCRVDGNAGIGAQSRGDAIRMSLRLFSTGGRMVNRLLSRRYSIKHRAHEAAAHYGSGHQRRAGRAFLRIPE